MIKSFKHKGLEIFYTSGNKKGIQSKHAEKISDILDILDAAEDIKDVNFPGSALHKLEPQKDQKWSFKISGAWRITFVFIDKNAYIIDYLNYH